jgi:hypothetical protein
MDLDSGGKQVTGDQPSGDPIDIDRRPADGPDALSAECAILRHVLSTKQQLSISNGRSRFVDTQKK